MDFLKPILSILPSIVNVVGGLFGGNENDYLKFSLRLPSSKPNGDEGPEGVYFFERDNLIWAGSNCKDNVQISFPSENGTFGDSYVLKCHDQFPINSAIHLHAVANVDTFEITAGGNPPVSTGTSTEDGKYSAVISATAKINKHTEELVQISTDISVRISGNDLTIMVQDHFILDGIPLLTISGEGNEPKRKYQNLTAGQPITVTASLKADSNQMTIPDALSPYIYSDYISISVSVNCSYDGNSEKIKALRAKQGIIQGTEKDWEFLKKGRCLNA